MRSLIIISLLLLLLTQVKGQQVPPKYLGDAVWRKETAHQERQPLAMTAKSYPIVKLTTKDSPLDMVTEKIDPGTVILHNGPIKPVVQPFRITGKKLAPPKLFPAPPLLTRDNAGFNISYTDKRHGFPAVITTDFAEDDAHNIWMATDNGILRYDGSQYYQYDQSNGFPDMTESSLLYDHQKRLWVVSQNGAYFLRNDSLFTISSQEMDFSKLNCPKVTTDRFNRVWITTTFNGAICIDGSNISIYDKRCGLPCNSFSSVYLDTKGDLYLCSNDNGLLVIEPNRIRSFFKGSAKLPLPIFTTVYEDGDGIWAGAFFGGLIRMGKKDTIRYSIDGKFNERIFGIIKTPAGMWISCYSKGLCYYDKKKLIIIDQNNGLVTNFAYRIFEDSYQNLWVSNGSSGFSRVNETGFYQQTYSNRSIGFVNNILSDQKNGHWFTTYGMGLVKHRNNEATTYSFKKPDQQVSDPLRYMNEAVVDQKGDLWIAAISDGIIRLNEKNFTIFNYQSIYGDAVSTSAKRDSANRLWFNTSRTGLTVFDNNRFWQYSEKSGLLNNDVTGLFLDAGKNLHWSFTEGFQRFNGPDIETFYIGNRLFKDKVNGLLGLGRETDLLATTINGLLLIHEEKVYQFSTAQGFTSNHIRMMIQDANGRIWITTEKGIESFRISGTNMTDHHVYNASDGPYIMDVKYAVLDTTGLPFWSEREYKMVFDSSFLKKKTVAPVFSFHRILSNTTAVALHDKISILPDQKVVIDFKTIYWGRENNLKMSYLLISDKSDTTERSIQNNGTIIISDVQAGTYLLRLKASDNDKSFYSDGLTISVRNFWYNTWTFRIIIGCLIIAGIIFFFEQGAKKQLAINKLLEKKVQEQTKIIVNEKDALFRSFQTIEKQNQEKDVLIDEINHRVKNNLQFIAAILELQLDNQVSNDIIQALLGTSRRIKAMSLVHELLYNKQEQDGLSIRAYIHELVEHLTEMAIDDSHPVNIEMDVDDISINSKTALPLGMIISELVSNSLKHAFKGIEDPEVRIELKHNPVTGVYRLKVSDNGNGYQPKTGGSNGLGRNLVDIFSRQLGGEYTIQSEKHFTYELHFKIIEP